ncbi:WD40-repeat-containing domain protein [Cokeromyces recurvatus]|uniref:WD40-repeat-containing domain protein n=1 Tax=Cokeromyces recurvatus TaxID=90255 RepID=UPI00222115D2|nr:WD40-repeat-containing domain protein [Cokeromyces recurvatus]KAI7905007.1 WD40-repeat-containing domain protein [Cokeromyces recurvatus]
MLAKTLEINWHDGQAIYSVDFSPDGTRYATAGADNSVRIWSIQKRSDNVLLTNNNGVHVEKKNKQLVDSLPVNIDFLSELRRHSSPVNVVRFSPRGDYLASAGDDACIILWKLSPSKESNFGNEYSDYEKETWTVVHMFYGHNKEIYDLAWSPCGKYFITASIDNTARVWGLLEKTCIHVFADHTHYVQGVSWDPLGQYIATQSSDRSMAIYRYRKTQTGKLQFSPCSRRFVRIDKGKIASANEDTTTTGSFRLYHDENLVSFFRRLSFSPDGGLLITPAGLNKSIEASLTEEENEMDENGDDLLNCSYIFPRNTILKYPVGFIGNYPKPSIAIRWCPMLFKKRRNIASMFALPYRMLYATATQDSIYIYDTQQSRPICAISGMHFAPITDLTWSNDGSILMFASADGYCSAAVFSDGELGTKYEKLPETIIQEHDIEMMEIPTNNNEETQKTIDDWTKSQKRRTSIPSMTHSTTTSTTLNMDKTKKRRITPILISSPSSLTTTSNH